MSELDPEVLAGVLSLLEEMQEDWEYDDTIEPQTRFIADLGLSSLDIVVLSTMIQGQFGKLPFPAFFDEIGRRSTEERDVSVSDIVSFVSAHRTVGQEA